MGIVAVCPNGHRIKVKDDLAGRKGICPTCAARFRIPRKQPQSGPARSDDAASAPTAARIVSRDPLVAASLPAAAPVDDHDDDASDSQDALTPDFVALTDEPDDDDRAAAASAFPPPRADQTPRHTALDERPDLAWCIAIRGGAPSALLGAADMRVWLDSGAASADHLVWRQDWPDWRPLPDVFPDALPPDPRFPA